MTDTLHTASAIATHAAKLVGGDRAKQHGDKMDTFENIARLWDGYLAIKFGPVARLSATDVGHLLVLLKLARTQNGELNLDDYVDMAGYAACAGEIAHIEAEERALAFAAR